MASKYSYEPIQGQDQVRLLVLKPGVDDVDFTFQVESLATNPMYEAISLDLDDLTDTRTVYCHEKALDIPHTLFIALEFLRYQDKERVLWADSVCTNQDDPLERNHQGKLRGAIFAKASQILIWLGGDASDLDGVQELVPHALSKLPKLDLERPNIDLVTLTKTWEDFIEREESLQKKGESNFLDYQWESLANLVNRPWFHRRWGIQEIWIPDEEIPKIIMCGNVQVKWTYLESLIYGLRNCRVLPLIPALSYASTSDSPRDPLMTNPEIQPTKGITSFYSMHQAKRTRKNSDLLDHLMMTAKLSTADPRDRIYALLGLSEEDFGLEPRYDLSVEDAYKLFARNMLIEHQNLRVLAFAPNTTVVAQSEAHTRLAIPSWVPDLSMDGPLNHLSKSVLRPQIFHAGGEETPQIRVSEDGNLLYLKGLIVDIVQTVGKALPEIPVTTPKPPPTDSSQQWLDETQEARLADWVKECSQTASNGDWKSLPEAQRRRAAKTMMADLMGMQSPIPEESIGNAVAYFDYLIALYEGRQEGPEKPSSRTLFFLQMALMSCALNRRFCTTENHRFGQIRREGRAGDVFAVFLGAEVPYLLRPTDHGTFNLIGDCFLLDMMNGEALEEGKYESFEITLE